MADEAARRVSGTEGYAESADLLAEKYESISFADVHRDILHLIPTTSSRVLDIGAGTGRDAAAFAALGHSVVAVEPTPELRAHGQRLHRSAGITWLDDALPDLSKVHERGERFDLVMLSAVWMHLDAEQRRRAMRRITSLLHPGALMVLSLRHGPVPAGRRMFDVSAAETCALARESGLETTHQSERDAILSRGVRLSVLAFRRGVA
jgi:SAM-dependent methyltransferase